MLPAVLLAVVVVPLATSPPAYAKGASAVEVSGPGVDDTRLRFTRDRTDVDVGSLAEVSGLYQLYGSAFATEGPGLTDAELGQRYVLTWYVHGSVMATSHVYPFATDGAWVHVLDNGWIRGGPDLEEAMVELGAGAPKVKTGAALVAPSVTAPAPAAGAPSPETETSSSVPVGGLAGVAGLVLLVGATAWWLRRRRTPQPA